MLSDFIVFFATSLASDNLSYIVHTLQVNDTYASLDLTVSAL